MKKVLLPLVTLFSLSLLGGMGYLVAKEVLPKPPVNATESNRAPLTLPKELEADDIDIAKLHSAINTERTKAGLSPLKNRLELENSAMEKCNDMVEKGYSSHKSPDGTEPWHFIDEQNVTYSSAGENLAYGYTSYEEVIKGWMASETHKANIIDTRFTDEGLAVCKRKNSSIIGNIELIVVQHLIAIPPRLSTYRVGALCNDGTESSATGSGACSKHDGVDSWLYNQ